MKAETKDNIYHVLVIAAMVTPPWNIFWWLVGVAVYYGSGGRKWDTSGDGALGIVFGAPVTLPALPFLWLREKWELNAYEKKQRRYLEAAEWIRDRLAEKGILVKEAGVGFNCAKVVAQPEDGQIPAYRTVCALAVLEFRDLTPDEILSNCQPLQYLDRAWAEKRYFKFFAEEVFTRPCVDCNAVESLGYFFGERAFFIRDNHNRRKPIVRRKDGREREIDGHICRKCLDEMGWVSMIG